MELIQNKDGNNLMYQGWYEENNINFLIMYCNLVFPFVIW